MSDAKANAALSESSTVEPSLPCIVDGTVAVRMERYASTVESTLDQRDLDSGVDEEVVRQSSSRHSLRQPVCEEAILPVSKDLAVPQVARKGSLDQCDQSSQGSGSPLHSPRDNAADAAEAMSPFYAFLHSKGLGDCCQYFPKKMSLAEFARLTEFELIHVHSIHSSHVREVVMHTIQGLEKVDTSSTHNEDDEVAALHRVSMSSHVSTPPRSPSPRKFYEICEIPSLASRRLLHRTFSEDMKGRRRRDSMPHSHSSQALNTITPPSSQSFSYNSETSNLLRMRNLQLGHSAPNLSSSMRDLSAIKRSSGRSAGSTPKKLSAAHPQCLSPQASLSSPVELRTPTTLLHSLKRHSTAESRRGSFASSGYSTTTAGSNPSPTLSVERINPFFCAHDQAAADCRERFSSSESNPALDEELLTSSALLSPLPRPRSRSFSCSSSIFSPTRAVLLDADSTFMMNSLYRERFPKAVQQMEEKLRSFIEEYTLPAGAETADATACFVHKQIVHLAQDCLDKCHSQLLSSLYFHELSENLRTLSVDVKNRESVSYHVVDKMIRCLLMIVSRTARLLECLEFDPDEFYCLLEQAEGQAKKTINTSDIPKYIVSKLQLARDPLEAILPQDLDDMEHSSLSAPDESDSLSICSDSNYPMKLPVEDDYEYIKQISNGAYGAVWLVRNKYTNQRCAMKKLLKTNLVLRNQVEQVFTERDILIFADNPFVVALYGSFETKKHLCLVMEYVEGGDCAALIKNMGGPLPLDMARMYFAETMLALEYIHDYGIVHRDLKPDNLLITNEGHIKLTDFGLSKMGIMNLTTNLVEGLLDRESKQFNDRQIFGTPEYIAPEVILRQGYGKPVDWWSMGVILYEFLVGITPFFGDSPEELFQMVLYGEIEFPQEEEYALPPEAQDLILRLLERDPLKRLGTTGARTVMEHTFVNDIDWDSLLRQKAEFIPNLESEEDTSYFDLRADRFPQHNEYEDDSDDDIMINSFSSCSPRYNKACQRTQEQKSQDHDSLSRQSSGSSSVFAHTQVSSDSGSDSPKMATSSDTMSPIQPTKSLSMTVDTLKSSLKSYTSTPKKDCPFNKDEEVSAFSTSIKRSASRSVSFDSETSLSLRGDSVTSPLVTPTTPPLAPVPADNHSPRVAHKSLRRSDALSPTSSESLHQKNIRLKRKADIFQELWDQREEEIDGNVQVTTPDSVFPPPTTPIHFDVIGLTPPSFGEPSMPSSTPTGNSNTLAAAATLSSPPSTPLSSPPSTPLSNSQSMTQSMMPVAAMPISLSGCPGSVNTAAQQSIELPALSNSKPHLPIHSSSDSSSSANNSPSSNTQPSNRKNRPLPASRLQRAKLPGNTLLAQVPEKGARPRSRTTPSYSVFDDGPERHHSLPEVSISGSSPSPPYKADRFPGSSETRSLKPTLGVKGQTNSCPVPIPTSVTSKSMFVKSASATQLSLLIPPPTEDFSPVLQNVLLSPTSSTSSRDQSPTRDALKRPAFILKKGSRGYGFFLKAIRVYSSDGHYYHLNHLITAVTEGSVAWVAGLRPNFLVTHINNEPVHGLPQPHIVRLIQKHTHMVTLRALPIEETSLKLGLKPPSELRKAKMIPRKAAKKKQSFSKVDRRRQRSSSLLKTLSKRNAETLALPVSEASSRLKSPRSPRLLPEWGLSQSFSSSSLSPISTPSSPACSFSFNRPGSLHGLSKSLQCIKSPNRRKSVHNIPLSPLARTPSPSPMAVSPTSHTPPSKLAVVGTKSGPSASTLLYNRYRKKSGSTVSSADEATSANNLSVSKAVVVQPQPVTSTATESRQSIVDNQSNEILGLPVSPSSWEHGGKTEKPERVPSGNNILLPQESCAMPILKDSGEQALDDKNVLVFGDSKSEHRDS
ncbi:microtubule-associated serine/threonine-protein kinase 3-like isoform X2 [Watersipora subatra]|uniref:microtubule-associated serine/threonine-protein kinase 3-like isoform X2 n=1 Tax=Watersipora subatra TaxID=2589382 RepID=UPI00355BF475